MGNNQTLAQMSQALESGQTSARALVETSLEAIDNNASDGGPVFIRVDADQARASADYMDALRKAGRAPSRFAGIPFSVKDLFDQAGQVTTAGSVVRAGADVAERDAVAIERLKLAGFVALGRTNMTEFAYSGVGLNPHYGTPKSIYDRDTGRIPGGSSSGAAVSVADGTCGLAIGTDTGGSCRVPAAFNGIVGYKPSHGRVPLDGVFPLATSFDSVGPLARSVQCCASADTLMSRDWPENRDATIAERPLKGLRLGVPQSLVLDDLDDDVAMVFGAALTRLACHGVEIVDVTFTELEELAAMNAGGGIAAVEAYEVHSHGLATQGPAFDQRVRQRILAGAKISAHDFLALKTKRDKMINKADALMAGLDGFIMPTCPHIPAAISDLDDDADYGRINLQALRNTFVGNFLNRCAISVPAHEQGRAPVGLMLMAPLFDDQALFSVAKAVEALVSHKTE